MQRFLSAEVYLLLYGNRAGSKGASISESFQFFYSCDLTFGLFELSLHLVLGKVTHIRQALLNENYSKVIQPWRPNISFVGCHYLCQCSYDVLNCKGPQYFYNGVHLSIGVTTIYHMYEHNLVVRRIPVHALGNFDDALHSPINHTLFKK